MRPLFSLSSLIRPLIVLSVAASGSGGAAAADSPAPSVRELPSAYDHAATVQRLSDAFTKAGLTIFARIDHRAGAVQAGLTMLPATVIIYGNPKGGTPLMNDAPLLALDLPLRVLVHDDAAGHTLVAFHPAAVLMNGVGLPVQRGTALQGAETLIAATISSAP
jgi:uncharacterized protein (DUF302 family)